MSAIIGRMSEARLEALGAIVARSALDLDKFLDHLPIAAVQVFRYGRALSFDPKTGLTLTAGADPEVGDEVAGCHGRMSCNDHRLKCHVKRPRHPFAGSWAPQPC